MQWVTSGFLVSRHSTFGDLLFESLLCQLNTLPILTRFAFFEVRNRFMELCRISENSIGFHALSFA